MGASGVRGDDGFRRGFGVFISYSMISLDRNNHRVFKFKGIGGGLNKLNELNTSLTSRMTLN